MAPAGTNAHIRVYSMKGSVTYDVGLPYKQKQRAVLSFDLPAIGSNTCSISGIGGSCTAGSGYAAEFTYSLRSPPGCKAQLQGLYITCVVSSHLHVRQAKDLYEVAR
jgi:hypothetical protein